MTFKAEINIEEIIDLGAKIEGIESKMGQRISDMLNIIGWTMHADSVEMIIQGPVRHGNKYERNGKTTTRSAWGEPAKSDTGNLQSSLEVQLFGSKSVKVGYLQSLAPYGEDLEDPTKLNRPVLATVQANNIVFIKNQIKRTVNEIIKL